MELNKPNIEPTSFSIGLAVGIVLVALLQIKVLRRMAETSQRMLYPYVHDFESKGRAVTSPL